MPDAELAAAADAGRLREPSYLEGQAGRLLASALGRQTFADVYRQWLLFDHAAGVSKDTAVYPSFTPRTMPALARGAEEFVQWATLDSPSGSWRELFES